MNTDKHDNISHMHITASGAQPSEKGMYSCHAFSNGSAHEAVFFMQFDAVMNHGVHVIAV